MAQQTIGIGTSANDGTGDALRDAMDKCNDNFTELYADVAELTASVNSPCISTSEPKLIALVKYVALTGQFLDYDFFYLSYVKNGPTQVTLKVSKTQNLSSAGAVVCQLDETEPARTGWGLVQLDQVSDSGISGYLIVDWDAITAETAYTQTKWEEAGLFGIVTAPKSQGQGYDAQIAVLTDDTVDVDGTKEMYTNDGAANDIDLTLVAFESLAGKIVINNVSDTYHISAYPEYGTVTINGASGIGITVEPNTNAEFYAYTETVWYVKGSYTLIPPP